MFPTNTIWNLDPAKSNLDCFPSKSWGRRTGLQDLPVSVIVDKEKQRFMTDRDYAIKSMKEITFQMATHAQDYLEVTMDGHYEDIKALMVNYQKLILENKMVLEDLEMECQEKINEDMAYALSYLDIYGKQLNVTKLRHEMNNLMLIYGLS